MVKDFIKKLLEFPLDYDVKLSSYNKDSCYNIFCIESKIDMKLNNHRGDVILNLAPSSLLDFPDMSEPFRNDFYSYDKKWYNSYDDFVASDMDNNLINVKYVGWRDCEWIGYEQNYIK